MNESAWDAIKWDQLFYVPEIMIKIGKMKTDVLFFGVV